MGLGTRDQHDERAIPHSGLSPIRRSVSPLCVAMLLLGFLILGASSATAIPIPIPENPLLGGGAVEKLTRGSGTSNYQFVLEGTEFESGWSNKQGDKIRIDIGFTPNVSSNFETMVVFTSIRFGVASNPVTCDELAPGGTNPLPLADFGFVTSPASVGGSVDRITESTDDRSGSGQKSQICQSENPNNLFSLVFDATSVGTTLSFSIEVAQTKDDVPLQQFANFQILSQAYQAVPEPGTGLLLLGGLAALARVSRRRARLG